MVRRRHVDRPAFAQLSLRLDRSDAHPRLDREAEDEPSGFFPRRGR